MKNSPSGNKYKELEQDEKKYERPIFISLLKHIEQHCSPKKSENKPQNRTRLSSAKSASNINNKQFESDKKILNYNKSQT